MYADEAKNIGLISETSHTMAAMKAESESIARHLAQNGTTINTGYKRNHAQKLSCFIGR